MRIYIARQPIFDKEKEVFGYELLFRDSLKNVCEQPDLNLASRRVIADSAMVFGLGTLTGDRQAFFNVTRESLLAGHVSLLPVERAVVELLETIQPDEEVLGACRDLKQKGYLLALDDFCEPERYATLLDLTDILKVDFLQTSPEEQASMVRRFSPRGIRLLAEKVETYDVFQRAVDMGYHLFQGYFFARPQILERKDVPGTKARFLQLLREIHQPDLDIDRIESVLKHDASLSYKLLRYINSAFFGWQVEIQSVRHAVILLGEKDFRKWATLVVVSWMGQDKPAELVVTAVFRARFLESLAPLLKLARRSQDMFLLGLFSLIDALTDQPAEEVLEDIPIARDIKSALGGEANELRRVLDLGLSYEEGRWQEFAELAKRQGLDEDRVANLYFQSVDWVQHGLAEGA
jgi:EAL and modified HD-GYP domain-containing signal transduction protein